MEDKIKELEKRIEELESIIKNISFGDGVNITISDSTFETVSIGDGANVDFKGCTTGTVVAEDGVELSIMGSVTGPIVNRDGKIWFNNKKLKRKQLILIELLHDLDNAPLKVSDFLVHYPYCYIVSLCYKYIKEVINEKNN